MKIKYLTTIILIICITPSVLGQSNNVVYQKLDTIIFNRCIQYLKPKKQSTTGELVIQTAVFLMDSPYVPKTLEITGKNEKLVVNLRQFDCVTLVESCIAMVHVLKSNNQSFDNYCNELKRIRYRNGELVDYSSRLHYFTEWISNNQTKGVVINLTAGFGGKSLIGNYDFMTRKSELYPQLSDPLIKKEMGEIEQNISKRMNLYIPKDKQSSSRIRNGDILCLTSKVQGIGVSHVGFAFRLGSELYFLHASQTNQKVEISSETFDQYLANRNNLTGYMVVRPL